MKGGRRGTLRSGRARPRWREVLLLLPGGERIIAVHAARFRCVFERLPHGEIALSGGRSMTAIAVC